MSKSEQDQQPIIKISFDDIQLTSTEKEINQVSQEAQKIAFNKMNSATTLFEYIHWHKAATQYLTPDAIRWMWDYKSPTAEELIEEQESESFVSPSQKNVFAIKRLKEKVDKLDSQEGKIRIALKKVKINSGIYDYLVLAIFPNGTDVRDPMDKYKNETEADLLNSNDSENIIFFQPESACVNQACGDLYKQYGDKAFYIENRPENESLALLDNITGGKSNYLFREEEKEPIAQDSNNYLLVGLLGRFANETNRVRVSDYWNR